MKFNIPFNIFFSIFFLFLFKAHSQPLYVIHTNGIIQNLTAGDTLKVGSKINLEDKLLFKAPNAVAAVIDPQKGRFTICADSLKNENNEIEFVSFVKDCFFLSQKRVSTRGGVINNFVDLQNHFSKRRYLILDTLKISINPETFPMSKNTFFYVRYLYENEIVNKRLESVENTLLISKETLFTIDGKEVPSQQVSDIKLYYYFTRGKDGDIKSLKICDFDPIFVDTAYLETQIELLISSLKPETEDEIENEVLCFLNEFYGVPNINNLRNWLRNNFVY